MALLNLNLVTSSKDILQEKPTCNNVTYRMSSLVGKNWFSNLIHPESPDLKSAKCEGETELIGKLFERAGKGWWHCRDGQVKESHQNSAWRTFQLAATRFLIWRFHPCFWCRPQTLIKKYGPQNINAACPVESLSLSLSIHIYVRAGLVYPSIFQISFCCPLEL